MTKERMSWHHVFECSMSVVTLSSFPYAFHLSCETVHLILLSEHSPLWPHFLTYSACVKYEIPSPASPWHPQFREALFLLCISSQEHVSYLPSLVLLCST